MARIRAVSLDFFNTIVRFDPMREQIQVAACAEFGITLDPNPVLRAYPVADQFLSEENGKLPLSRRTPEDARELWGRYEMLLLARVISTLAELPDLLDTINAEWTS